LGGDYHDEQSGHFTPLLGRRSDSSDFGYVDGADHRDRNWVPAWDALDFGGRSSLTAMVDLKARRIGAPSN
jgi:hypothetical protein